MQSRGVKPLAKLEEHNMHSYGYMQISIFDMSADSFNLVESAPYLMKTLAMCLSGCMRNRLILACMQKK